MDDFLDDPDILKDLISTSGLMINKGWTEKRLNKLESGVKVAESFIEKAPTVFVHLENFGSSMKALEEQGDRHAQQLLSLDSQTSGLRDDADGFRKDLDRETVRLSELYEQARINREDDSSKFENLINALKADVEKQRQHVLGEMKDLRKYIETSSEQITAETASLLNDLKASLKGNMTDLEQRAFRFSKSTVEEAMEGLTTPVKEERTKYQVQLLEIVGRRQIEGMKKGLDELIEDHTSALRFDVGKLKDDLLRKTRENEKLGTDNKNRLRQALIDMQSDCDSRSKREDTEALEEKMLTRLDEIDEARVQFEEISLLKFNQFVDHFTKINEVIDDHEHCIRHHAEDIEDRCTKYDLLVFKTTVVQKDFFEQETATLRNAIMSNTIVSDGVISTNSLSGKNSPLGKGKIRRAEKWASSSSWRSSETVESLEVPAQPMQSTLTSVKEDSHEPSRDDAELEQPPAATEQAAASPVGADLDDEAQVFREEPPEGWPSHTLKLYPSLISEEPQVTGFVADSEEDSGEKRARNRAILEAERSLKDMLEITVTALVVLARLSLRKNHGTDQKQRAAFQENIFLEELGAVRKWICEKSPPPGWSAQGLTTLLLSMSEQSQGVQKSKRFYTGDQVQAPSTHRSVAKHKSPPGGRRLPRAVGAEQGSGFERVEAQAPEVPGRPKPKICVGPVHLETSHRPNADLAAMPVPPLDIRRVERGATETDGSGSAAED